MHGRQSWRGRWLILVSALLLAITLPHRALAGGVSVILDSMPRDVEAGVPFDVGFTIQSAHEDRTLMTGLQPRLLAKHTTTHEEAKAEARATGAKGHYVATLVLPSAGAWQWSVQPFFEEPDYSFTLQGPLKVRVAGAVDESTVASGTETIQDAKMLDSVFEPAAITVEAGTTVVWHNLGKLPHTVTANDGRFSSGGIEAGGEFSFTFTEPGTYAYRCEYHAPRPAGSGESMLIPISTSRGGGGHMTGTITVVAVSASIDVPGQAASTGSDAAADPASALLAQVAGDASTGNQASVVGQSATLPASGSSGIPMAFVLTGLFVLSLGLLLRRLRPRAR